jgi:predicted small integral membrane protein
MGRSHGAAEAETSIPAVAAAARLGEGMTDSTGGCAAMALRYSKIVMCLCLAAFAFMATFGNITDYGSNFAFVQHVLSMDTTFPGNALMYRAITNPALWTAGYGAIIAGEGLTCLLFLIAAGRLWSARNGSGEAFNDAKSVTVLAATVGFLVWFAGFMVIGGEWFAMWQSSIWNGQEPAFRFYITILAVLIFVIQPDRDVQSR